ncbi:MAG: hypothetical protein ACRD4I_04340 [Candidatus Angelobacter sp.]
MFPQLRSKHEKRCALFFVALLLVFLQCRVQAAPLPTITFSLDFPGSDPERYSITLSSDGHASYQSNGKLAIQREAGAEDEFDFVLSPGTTRQIFDFAKRAHYFEKQVDAKKNVASTGVKTLTYQDGEKQTKATYNYSTVSAVQALTRLFQDLSTTLEFGRRLQYSYRYQKLALNEQLTKMEEAINDNRLGDISPILPILDEIVKDPSVINVARARAMRIAAKAK